MPPKLKDKIKKLKDYWYNDDYSLKVVDEIERNIRTLVSRDNLAQNKAVVPIIEDARRRISAIDSLLINDADMTDDVRKMLIREKNVHRFWLSRFDGSNVEDQMALIERSIDSELEGAGLVVE